MVEGLTGHLWLWTHPLPGGSVKPSNYVIGGDIANGQGATASCFSIVDARTGEKVGEYANPFIEPTPLASVAVALCHLFCDEDGGSAKLIWEHNGPGISFGSRVLSLGFRNVYRRGEDDADSLNNQATERTGWVPTQDTIPVLHEDYASALSLRQFTNRSEVALKECLSFHYNQQGKIEHSDIKSLNDPSGARINHGDRCVSDALAWKLAKGQYIEVKKVEEETAPAGSLLWRRQRYEAKQKRLRAWA